MATSDPVLKELQSIREVLENLEAIRGGDYEPPKGADRDGKPWMEPMATPDDIYRSLDNLIGILEHQNRLIRGIGAAMVGDENEWHRRFVPEH